MTTDLRNAIDIAILEKMGIEIDVLEANRLVARLPFAPNANHVGTIYAGSLFSLAEFPAGVLMVKRFGLEKFAPVVADMKIRYRRPAQSMVTVDMKISDEQYDAMEKAALAEGKGEMTLSQELTDEEGTVVAITEARYVLLKR